MWHGEGGLAIYVIFVAMCGGVLLVVFRCYCPQLFGAVQCCWVAVSMDAGCGSSNMFRCGFCRAVWLCFASCGRMSAGRAVFVFLGSGLIACVLGGVVLVPLGFWFGWCVVVCCGSATTTKSRIEATTPSHFRSGTVTVEQSHVTKTWERSRWTKRVKSAVR